MRREEKDEQNNVNESENKWGSSATDDDVNAADQEQTPLITFFLKINLIYQKLCDFNNIFT